MAIPEWLQGKADEDVRAALREQVDGEHDRLADGEKLAFFVELGDGPADDPAAEWDRYVRHAAQVDERVAALRSAALDRFDREVAALPPAEAADVVYGDDALWSPGFVAERRRAAQYPDEEPTAEERLAHAIDGTGPVRRHDRAGARRQAARDAADQRDYAAWREAHPHPDPAVLAAAAARVDRDRAAIERRFADDWGIDLPDGIFRYWQFQLSLGPAERRALNDLDLEPYGIMDLFDDPGRRPRDGVDVRVHGRYYRDPPEFLTFMHGGSDGLHFGLWYDDGRTCAGVTCYYNNDGGGVGLPFGTPLAAVREQIEWSQVHLDREAGDGATPAEDDVVAQRFGLRALRELLTRFETGDRPEQGAAYHDTYRPAAELFAHGDPARWETLDGGGALADGEPVVPRGHQRPYDGYEWCRTTYRQLTEEPDTLAGWTAEAEKRCAAGDPTGALALGRDLHWISQGDADRERRANALLVAAYRALGRDALAGIADAHHRHRNLPQVTVLDR
ncbi:DUF2228 domain-containing protein [Actinocatenispora rupis]|uniref:Uncharacterized protein n=1 Tax=Actinocatenispora rupis TaxID=519421 RepID=A0A8J3J137_9ACTN|nr:DUF2228 domain-containing protein [Actinocatenispora rupis]GID12278.1 hypothetical protein Aru02nite_31670 [Actinocatenispora rupis]